MIDKSISLCYHCTIEGLSDQSKQQPRLPRNCILPPFSASHRIPLEKRLILLYDGISKAILHKGQCVRCAVRFFVRLNKSDAAILLYGKELLSKMAEKVQADDVLSRQAVFVRCCR